MRLGPGWDTVNLLRGGAGASIVSLDLMWVCSLWGCWSSSARERSGAWAKLMPEVPLESGEVPASGDQEFPPLRCSCEKRGKITKRALCIFCCGFHIDSAR